MPVVASAWCSVISDMCDFVYLCLHNLAINTKLGRHTVRGCCSACVEPEVMRLSNVLLVCRLIWLLFIVNVKYTVIIVVRICCIIVFFWDLTVDDDCMLLAIRLSASHSIQHLRDVDHATTWISSALCRSFSEVSKLHNVPLGKCCIEHASWCKVYSYHHCQCSYAGLSLATNEVSLIVMWMSFPHGNKLDQCVLSTAVDWLVDLRFDVPPDAK